MLKYGATRLKIQNNISFILPDYETYKEINDNIFHSKKINEQTINKIWTTIYDKRSWYELSIIFAITNLPLEIIYSLFNEIAFNERNVISSILYVPNKINNFIATSDEQVDKWLELVKIEMLNSITVFDRFNSINVLEHHINNNIYNANVESFTMLNDIQAEKCMIVAKQVSDTKYIEVYNKILAICKHLDDTYNKNDFMEYANTKLKKLDLFLSKFTSVQLNDIIYLKQL